MVAAARRYRPGSPLPGACASSDGKPVGSACVRTRLPRSRELLGAWARDSGDVGHFVSWIVYTHWLDLPVSVPETG